MLANRSNSMNFTAVSELEGESIASFNASYNGNTKMLIFSKTINNLDVYKLHTDVVEADYSQFQEEVIEAVG